MLDKAQSIEQGRSDEVLSSVGFGRRKFLLMAAATIIQRTLTACGKAVAENSPDSKETIKRLVSLLEPGTEFEMLGTHSEYQGARDIVFGKDGVPLKGFVEGQVLWIEREDQWNEKENDIETRGGVFIDIIVKDSRNRFVLIHMSHLSGIATNSREKRSFQPGDTFMPGEVLVYSGHSGNARRLLGTPKEKVGYHVHIGFQLVEELPPEIKRKIEEALRKREGYRIPSRLSRGATNHDPGRFLANLLTQPGKVNLSEIFDDTSSNHYERGLRGTSR